jgi:hypothetical protein
VSELRDGEWALSHLAASRVTGSPLRVTGAYAGALGRIEQGIKGALDGVVVASVLGQEAILYLRCNRLLA